MLSGQNRQRWAKHVFRGACFETKSCFAKHETAKRNKKIEIHETKHETRNRKIDSDETKHEIRNRKKN